MIYTVLTPPTSEPSPAPLLLKTGAVTLPPVSPPVPPALPVTTPAPIYPVPPAVSVTAPIPPLGSLLLYLVLEVS